LFWPYVKLAIKIGVVQSATKENKMTQDFETPSTPPLSSEPPKKNNTLLIVIIVAVLLVFSCCCIAILGAGWAITEVLSPAIEIIP
jgi:hypothetical protein